MGKTSCLVTLLLAICTKDIESTSVVIDPVNSNPSMGSTLKLVCKVAALSRPDTIVYWKRTVASVQEDVTHNSGVQPPFNDLKIERYTVSSSDWSQTSRTYTLTIANIQPQDCGSYECSAEGITTTKDIVVYGDMNEVNINSYKNGEIVDFTEEMITSLKCVVNDTARNTALKAYLTTSNGRTDITNQFLGNASPKIVTIEGIRAEQSDLSLTNDKFPISRQYNGKDFVCEAAVAVAAKSKSAKITLNVLHKPEITCKGNNKYDLGAVGVSLSCIVSANPTISKDQVKWHLPNNITLSPGEQTGPYRAMFNEKDGKAEVKLLISKVHSGHFTTYNITAKNTRGTAVSHVTLSLIGASKPAVQGPSDGGSSSSIPSIIALVMAFGSHIVFSL